MYFLCTLQADLEETRREGYIGEWMTKAEKKDAILKFYKQKQHIPLSINHTTAKEYGAAIPKNERVGRVLDLFNDKDGDLVAKCVIDKDSKAIHRLNKGSYVDGEKWGVSVRIDWSMPGGVEGGRIDKLLTHVALTQTPYLADEGSYIHHWSTNEKAVDNAIHRDYFQEGVGHCFAAPELIHKINAGRSSNKSNMSEESVPNATPVTTPNNNVSQEQQQSQTQSNNQQQQQQQSPSQQQDATKVTPNTASTRLVDMEAELQEMELLITPETPMQKMPPSFRMRYLQQLEKIDAKKQEIQTHVNYLLDNKVLSAEEAKPYLNGINDTDLKNKRPVYGYLEASYEDRVRTAQASNAMMRVMEENNKRILADKDKAVHELESLKKKVRLNEYSAPTEPQRHRYDEFGGPMTMATGNTPLQKETISLLRLNEKPNGETISRQVIHETNLRAMFEYDVDKMTTIEKDAGGQMGKLANFMAKWA